MTKHFKTKMVKKTRTEADGREVETGEDTMQIDVLEIEDYDHDNAVGGLGRFLAFTLADDYSYEYTDGKNILKLYFKNEVNKDDDNKNA